MYHGDRRHTGFAAGSELNSGNVGTPAFGLLHELQLGGPVLSVPAVTDGFVYVGLANYHQAAQSNGGALHKIDLAAGAIVNTFSWELGDDDRDAHGFTGMAVTPAVVGGRIYFGAFNGKMYCLDQETLESVWVTDLRNADPAKNQPVTNTAEVPAWPAAVIWTSPVVSIDGSHVYVGCGEGENPYLFSFVFCLDASTGAVEWMYCTNQFIEGVPNQPNQLPASTVSGTPPAPFSVVVDQPIVMGCSVWGAIAYDDDTGLIYCPTGNQQPEPQGRPELPSPGYSNGLLCLEGETGRLKAFFQVPPESCYRVTDMDIDVASAPVVFTAGGTKYVGLGCKNGSFFLLDPETLELVRSRQLLPRYKDGTQIPTIDPHPSPDRLNELNPHISNEESNSNYGENYFGSFNAAAFCPAADSSSESISARLFVALGGPNYHNPSPGIDFNTTPFMRAVDAVSLADVWPQDDNDPPRYSNAMPPMYTNAGESGLSSPAVVNDVVFCSTTNVSVYAFSVRDGTLLWHDDLGMQTKGYNGGYGYCLGPAIWRNYVVAGALVNGRDGGILRIWGLKQAEGTVANNSEAPRQQ